MIIVRRFLVLLSLLESLSLWAAKPNMVFIIADDLTFRDIGCYGGQAKTPHIDKLATKQVTTISTWYIHTHTVVLTIH